MQVSYCSSLSHLHWIKQAFILPTPHLSAHNLCFPEISWLVTRHVWVRICQLICLITIIWNKCIFLFPLSIRHPPVIKFYFISFLLLVPMVVSVSDAYRISEGLPIFFFLTDYSFFPNLQGKWFDILNLLSFSPHRVPKSFVFVSLDCLQSFNWTF